MRASESDFLNTMHAYLELVQSFSTGNLLNQLIPLPDKLVLPKSEYCELWEFPIREAVSRLAEFRNARFDAEDNSRLQELLTTGLQDLVQALQESEEKEIDASIAVNKTPCWSFEPSIMNGLHPSRQIDVRRLTSALTPLALRSDKSIRLLVFGSQAGLKKNVQSDLDLAVISELFAEIPFLFRRRLVEASLSVWLDVICLSPVELANNLYPAIVETVREFGRPFAMLQLQS